MTQVTPILIEEHAYNELESIFAGKSILKKEFWREIISQSKRRKVFKPKRRDKIIRVQAELDDRDLQFLTKAAIENGLSRAELERIVIDNYLEKATSTFSSG